jgi:hypothetical protein
MIRYLRITLDDGTRFILRVTGESRFFIRGIEVNVEGDEVVPPGAHQRLRVVDRGRIKKTVEMRMNPTYATLEVVPKRMHAQLNAEIDEALRAKKWQEQVEREDRERRARLARTRPTPAQLYEEYQSDLAAGVFHGEQRGRARDFRTDKATRKRIPDAVSAAIAAGALEIIEGSYRRHATTGGKEPCVTVGLVADYLRQGSMPEDFRWATKDRQRAWTRSVLESMRRKGQIGSSLGARARCYEPKR